MLRRTSAAAVLLLGLLVARSDVPAAQSAPADAAATLTELDEAWLLGMDPASMVRGLMEELHAATRAKAGGGSETTTANRWINGIWST